MNHADNCLGEYMYGGLKEYCTQVFR